MKRPVATVAIVAVLVLTLTSVVTAREMWPFSAYPMYSRPAAADVTTSRRLEGLTGGRWFELTDEHVAPFKRSILLSAINRAERQSPDAVNDALLAVSRVYDLARHAGRHGVPRLEAIRVRELSYVDLDPGRRAGPEPDEVRTVAELGLDILNFSDG